MSFCLIGIIITIGAWIISSIDFGGSSSGGSSASQVRAVKQVGTVEQVVKDIKKMDVLELIDLKQRIKELRGDFEVQCSGLLDIFN